ncbi:MAG: hypothetical protein JWP76_1558 [Dactylosporangium sp.]|nr:hypothetical protein [Dactylosporangium sp.]
MSVNGQEYARLISDLLPRVMRSQAPQVARAADLVTESIRHDGVLHAFGTGHSEALAMEIAGRTGGLVPTNRLALRDIVLFGDEPAGVLGSSLLERDPTVARRILDLAPIRDGDVFVIASNSGVNGVVVEMARLVKQRGLGLIAFTSLEHSLAVPSRHACGQRLCDIADVVLDNGAPYGDATLPLPGGGATGAVSSITSAALAQMVIADVIGRLIDAGESAPVYLSANIPGGDEHNDELEARYAGRIRRGA